MNNVTIFETAAKLKAAGFPQPVPEFGQVWYNRNGHLCICIKNFTHDSLPGVMFFNTAADATFSLPESDFQSIAKHDTFAPTATDILRELGFEYNLWYSVDDNSYRIGKDAILMSPEIIASLSNPAEAAALAWLEVNKN